MIEDWDDAYANGAHIEGAADYPPRWTAAAAKFREEMGERVQLDLAYGDAARRRYDLFAPEGSAKGLVLFVHGGYWRAFDKSVWSHFSAGPLARGWAVAMPSYTLAPEARIGAITTEIGAALTAAASEVDGPIRIAGHSAGGHLITRMLCENAPLGEDVGARIERAVSISGVHDLRPLLKTAMNDDLHLTPEEAATESPALLAPRPGVRLTCWVGAEERPEFVRQNALLANVWTGLGAQTDVVETPGEHHFNVIDGLLSPDAPLTTALCG